MNKISKILLPISTMSLVASAVTPLVSCNKDEWANAIDLTKFEPTISPCTKDKLTEEGATEEVFTNSQAKEIVKQDILWYLRYEADTNLRKILEDAGITWAGNVKQELAVLSNLEMEYNTTEKRAYLSGNIKLKVIFDMHKKDDITKIIGTYSVETTHNIHNLPYRIVYTEASGDVPAHWSSWFSREELEANKKWDVRRNYYILANYDEEEVPDEEIGDLFRYSYLNISDWEMLVGYYNYEALKMVCWSSYFLQNVAKDGNN